MKAICTISIFSIVMVALSCGSDSKTESSNASDNTSPAINNTTQTQAIDPVPVSNSVVTPTNGNNNSIALNPAHGEPGHRCDIPVGSPLNSKPAQQPDAKNTQSEQPQVITEPAGNSTTASGLNPQHGEPGHRCDIAVGAPLNSQPKKQ